MIRFNRPHLTAGDSEGPRLRTATGLVRVATESALFRRILLSEFVIFSPRSESVAFSSLDVQVIVIPRNSRWCFLFEHE
jgi:hypothetical protein